MINFSQHSKLAASSVSNADLEDFFKRLTPMERIKMKRSIDETYPLRESTDITDYIKDNFMFYTDVNDLVLGQFIMIEQIMTGKIDDLPAQKIDLEIAKLILRPKSDDLFDNEDQEKERANELMILKSPVQDVYNVITAFVKNRDEVLFKQFSGVFYEEPDETTIDSDIQHSPTPDALFNQQWYWYSIVRMLAQEDIRRYDEIYMLPMSKVLPEMSYLSQKNKLDAAQRRQEAALSKVRR